MGGGGRREVSHSFSRKPSILTPGQVEIVQTLRQKAPSCIVSQVSVQNQGLWEVPEYPGVQSHFGEWDLRGRRRDQDIGYKVPG